MRICPECKKKYDDATTFCLEDGAVLNPVSKDEETAALAADDLPATQIVPPATQAAIPPTQMFQGEGKSKGKKSKQKNFTNPPPQPKVSAASTRPPQNNSALPIAIIGLVLFVAVVGGWFWYSSTAKVNPPTAANKTPNKTAENFATEVYPKGVPGANPPNLLGAPNAAITVEEFADFQCGTCAAKHPVAKEIIAAYGSRIKFIFRHYPLTQIHDKAYDAAVAAEAAGLQGKFWDMQNQLFTNQSSWATKDPVAFRAVLEEYAQKIGLDVEKFKTDMAGLAAKSRVDLDMQRGRSLRVNSTPTFYVNGKPVTLDQMTAEGFKQMIDAELQKTQQ